MCDLKWGGGDEEGGQILALDKPPYKSLVFYMPRNLKRFLFHPPRGLSMALDRPLHIKYEPRTRPRTFSKVRCGWWVGGGGCQKAI